MTRMTMTEKILASHAGLDTVSPGQLIQARLGVDKVWDRERVCLVPDHFTPNRDIKAAEQVKMMRVFAREKGIVNYFEIGEMGIEHALLPELGLVLPGDLVTSAPTPTRAPTEPSAPSPQGLGAPTSDAG